MINRRHFSFLSAGFPTIVKASALGLNGAVPASDRIVMATIGVGGMGQGHIKEFLKVPDAQIVAVCDVEDANLIKAKGMVDTGYSSPDCATYRAFEEVLLRRDIDAVSLALPDHWHGIVAVRAAQAGKDIYGEKPLAHNFREGVAIREAVKRNKRIWQTGSWQRSRENFRRGCELVRNGRIGKVTRVEVGLPGGPAGPPKDPELTTFTDPPRTLHYDRWLGPAPEAPYCPARVHFHWRWNLAYGGGQLMDWIGHHGDIAHWGLGFDNTGPLEIEGKGEYPPRDALYNTATKYMITARYANDVTIIYAGGYKEIPMGTKFIGEKGWIYVERGNKLEAEPANILTSSSRSGDIQLPDSPGHYRQFIDCVKTRAKTLTPAEVALRSVTPGWLGQIAMLTGRKIRWDPEKEQIIGDPEAEKMLGRDMRSPWRL